MKRFFRMGLGISLVPTLLLGPAMSVLAFVDTTNMQTTPPVDTAPPAPASVSVSVVVNNTNGGQESSEGVTVTVTATNPSQSSFNGTQSPTITFDAGSYSVTGSDLTGYNKTSSEGCSGTLSADASASCTITYTDKPGQIQVKGLMINDASGTLSLSDVTAYLYTSQSEGAQEKFTLSEAGDNFLVPSGDYNVTAGRGIEGYTITYSDGCSGTIPNGEYRECLITLDDFGKNAPPETHGQQSSGGAPAAPVAEAPAPAPTPAPETPSSTPTTTPTSTPSAEPRVLGASTSTEPEVPEACRLIDVGAKELLISTDELVQALGIHRDIPLETHINELLLHRVIPEDATGTIPMPVTNFTAYGTASTIILGSGERAGVIASYIAVYGHMPMNGCDWADALRIARGVRPVVRNEDREHAMETTFQRIYRRAPVLENAVDHRTLDIMSYGLRPTDRSLHIEHEAAMTSFRDIFHHIPSTTTEWDTLRGMAYGGLPLPQ